MSDRQGAFTQILSLLQGVTVMKVVFRIYRKKNGVKPYFQDYTVNVDPDSSVLDVIEKIALKKDPSLTFNHACHHGVCGACGMIINGVERLACITKVKDVVKDGVVRVEPLKGFKVISDLYVEMNDMFYKIESINPVSLIKTKPLAVNDLPEYVSPVKVKLDDCIECGICYSACPIANSSERYLGPAALALAFRAEKIRSEEKREKLANSIYGVWSCHVAFECSNLCPTGYDPGSMIMMFRRQLLVKRLLSFLGRR